VDRDDQEETRPTLPFEGLHVYQRAQDAWGKALTAGGADPLWVRLEKETRNAALGIARATARSRSNGSFGTELEQARGALHAAAAIVDQLMRRGDPVDDDLRGLLIDSSRMLGALVRSVSQPREAAEEIAV